MALPPVTLSMMAVLAITNSNLTSQLSRSPRASTRVASARIDRAVFTRLKKLGLQPAARCSDAVFLRRVYLDLAGRLPSVEACRSFLRNQDPSKRSALIDALLESRGYADLMAMRWSDLLRIKSEFPINLWPNASQAYYQWVWQSFRDNKPQDRFVRELLVSNGSNFRVAPVNFYRALQNKKPATIARAVALTFMGVRADKWPAAKLASMSAFFDKIHYKPSREWKEEIVFHDPSLGSKKSLSKGQRTLQLPDGKEVQVAAEQDPRAVFADWLIRSSNPWFTKSAVNRAWAWLFGRGIIDEVDDIRPDNPPVHPELLKLLQSEFVTSHYDWKHLFRIIMNSRVYQQDSKPASQDARARSHFACYPTRRLPAEVLIDTVNEITGTTESYTSMIPEPFTFIPAETPAIRLPDGSISSASLEMFGRPSRDTGFVSERNNRPTPTQRLYLLNSTQVQNKITRGTLLRRIQRKKRGKLKDIVDELYLRILSRHPTTEELGILYGMAKNKRLQGRNALIDIAWALLNTAEFQYRH